MVKSYNEYLKETTPTQLAFNALLIIVASFGYAYFYGLPKAVGFCIGLTFGSVAIWLIGAYFRRLGALGRVEAANKWQAELLTAIQLANVGQGYFTDAAFVQSGLHTRVWVLVKEGIACGYIERDGT